MKSNMCLALANLREALRWLCRLGIGVYAGSVVVALGAGGCSTPQDRRDSQAAGVAAVLAEVEAGRLVTGAAVRVTGVVTDVDVDRRLAFIAEENRALAIRTGAAGLSIVPGQRVTLEARLASTPAGPLLSEPSGTGVERRYASEGRHRHGGRGGERDFDGDARRADVPSAGGDDARRPAAAHGDEPRRAV